MQIHLIKNEQGLDEWILMEMQGTIEHGLDSLSGQMLGNLAWRKDESEALLLFEHHLLEGKVANLEKPFLVVVPNTEEGKKSMTVEAIIQRRIVFKNRPKPIVTKQFIK